MSRHHRAQQWSTYQPKFKALIAAQLPAPCVECGRPVMPGDRWEVGHRTPAALGGQPTLANVGPVHWRCNHRKGGQLGAAMTHRRRRDAKGLREW